MTRTVNGYFRSGLVLYKKKGFALTLTTKDKSGGGLDQPSNMKEGRKKGDTKKERSERKEMERKTEKREWRCFSSGCNFQLLATTLRGLAGDEV